MALPLHCVAALCHDGFAFSVEQPLPAPLHADSDQPRALPSRTRLVPPTAITDAHRYASVVATGPSDYPNQINNVLAFPGMFAGAFDSGARAITENMKLAAARALGDVVAAALTPDLIVPTPFDPRVAPAVAAAVADQARLDRVAAGPVPVG